MNARVALGTSLLWILACTGGASLNENSAGKDSYVDDGAPPVTETGDMADDDYCAWNGSLAVDGDVERVFVLLNEAPVDCAELATDDYEKTVWAVGPDDPVAVPLIDVTGHTDLRLLFPEDGILVMGEVDGADALYLLDRDTLQVTAQRDTDARYHGTRMSPTRSFVAVADNNDPLLPIHILDPATLETVEVQHDGDWLEAMWLDTSDRLAAISFDLASQQARILVWSLDGEDGVPAEMPAPEIDVRVDDVYPNLSMSFTWIGVHPEDSHVVFPVGATYGPSRLLILDPATGTVRSIEDAEGPVAFTPDGSTLVAWTDDPDELVLIDPVSLDSERVPAPSADWPTYFVSHDGNQVVVGSTFEASELVLHDLDTGTTTRLGYSLHLDEFTSRLGEDELWIVDNGLYRLDFLDGLIEPVDPGWIPQHINWLPGHDLLALDDIHHPQIRFWDPVTRSEYATFELDRRRSGPRVSLAR